MIGVIAVVVLLAVLVGIGVMVSRSTEVVHLIPTPRGPLPVPTDAQLLAARIEHPVLLHGQERLDEITGMRYRWCVDCRHWTDPEGWFQETYGNSVGNEVTTDRHNCPLEDDA